MTNADPAVAMSRISKEKLEDMEWELRAWRETFPDLTYNKLYYRIEGRLNGKERKDGEERTDRGPDRTPSAPL